MITESLSDSKLNWGYWYVTRKLFLRQLLVYFLIFINLNLWFFAFFFVFKIYFFDNPSYVFAVNKLSNSGVNYSTFNQANQPKELVFGSIDVLKSGSDKYDLILKVKNPNANWLGRVSGKFIINQKDQSGETAREDSIVNILDGEEKYIILAGVVSPEGVSSPQFKINYIQWHRIKNHDVFNDFVNNHANFDVSEVKYKTSSDLKLGSQVQVSGLSFKIQNNSLYDYWRVDNKILFKRAGSIAAVAVAPVEEFKIDQLRVVDFRIFDNLVNISSVEVYPEVDIFDENNIMEEPFAEGYLK
ncbi:MAG: hypothetical protein V1688_02045 [bacterium]